MLRSFQKNKEQRIKGENMELVDELRIKNEELELENKILIEKVKENKLLKKENKEMREQLDSILYSRSYKIVNKISNIIKRS